MDLERERERERVKKVLGYKMHTCFGDGDHFYVRLHEDGP
jgi:hypothetical protein